MEGFQTLFLFGVLALLYFLPTVMAVYNNRQAGSVFIVNLTLGWSIIGWIIAAVMSMPAPPRQ